MDISKDNIELMEARIQSIITVMEKTFESQHALENSLMVSAIKDLETLKEWKKLFNKK